MNMSGVKASTRTIAVAMFAAFLVLVYINHQISVGVDGLRENINSLAAGLCQRSTSRQTILKYDDFVRAAIETQHQAIRLNEERGDYAKAALSQRAAERYTRDLIDVPPPPDCSKPLLPKG